MTTLYLLLASAIVGAIAYGMVKWTRRVEMRLRAQLAQWCAFRAHQLRECCNKEGAAALEGVARGLLDGVEVRLLEALDAEASRRERHAIAAYLAQARAEHADPRSQQVLEAAEQAITAGDYPQQPA